MESESESESYYIKIFQPLQADQMLDHHWICQGNRLSLATPIKSSCHMKVCMVSHPDDNKCTYHEIPA